MMKKKKKLLMTNAARQHLGVVVVVVDVASVSSTQVTHTYIHFHPKCVSSIHPSIHPSVVCLA